MITLSDIRSAAWGMIFAAVVLPAWEILTFGAAADGAFVSGMRAIWGAGAGVLWRRAWAARRDGC